MNKNTHTKIYIHLKHVQIIQTILYTTKQNKTQTLQTKMQPNIIIICVTNDNNQNAQVHTNKKRKLTHNQNKIVTIKQNIQVNKTMQEP
jgi:hypothetical protein